MNCEFNTYCTEHFVFYTMTNFSRAHFSEKRLAFLEFTILSKYSIINAMPFYDPILKLMGFNPIVKKDQLRTKTLTLPEMMDELGVRTSSILGSYSQEENPDVMSPDTYIYMQENDGTVRSIVRIFTMPVVATPLRIIPAEGDKGEADFIRSVFFDSPKMGGMTTPLPFVIADMCRAISEGFRLYEKIPQVITQGRWVGKIGWRKLAPRDSLTIKLRSDEHGGFNGAFQQAIFGTKMVQVVLPVEKCLLFTFQKEKHSLYGESILKTAYYHYDKKHKLYYLAHKKAELDAIGLKILKVVSPNLNDEQVKSAETAIEQIGVNTRITMPQGMELEIDRSPSGYNVLDLIEHHDTQMKISALTQATQMGTGQKYSYPYGKGFSYQNTYLSQSIDSIMRSMEHTLNEWAINPLIDWNFNSQAYPKIQFISMTSEIQSLLNDIFYAMLKRREFALPKEFESKVINNIAEKLGLEFTVPTQVDALNAFEGGKKSMSNLLKIPAPITDQKAKVSLSRRYIELKEDPDLLIKMESFGKDFVLNMYKDYGTKLIRQKIPSTS